MTRYIRSNPYTNALRVTKDRCRLRMMQMGLRIISNKCCDCLASVMNDCKCLQICLQTLQTYLWMMRMSHQCCHCLAIFLRMMRIFDDEAAIGIKTGWIYAGLIVFLNLKRETTVERHWRGLGNGERYKRLANALRTLQMFPNALPTLTKACECLRKLTANSVTAFATFTEI